MCFLCIRFCCVSTRRSLLDLMRCWGAVAIEMMLIMVIILIIIIYIIIFCCYHVFIVKLARTLIFLKKIVKVQRPQLSSSFRAS